MLGAGLFRDRVVGGVADEQVTKAIGAPAEARAVGANQLLADERLRASRRGRVEPVRRELRDRVLVEDLALTAARSITAARRRRAGRGGPQAAPGSSAAPDRRTSPVAIQRPSWRTSTPSSISIESISSTKSGLPSAASRSFLDSVCQFAPGRRGSRSAGRISLVGQRLEQNRGGVELSACPPGAHIEELRAGEADEQDRRVARPVGDVLDEIEERGLAPVDVVEDDDERLARAPAPRTASARTGSRPRRPPRPRRGRSTRPRRCATSSASVLLARGPRSASRSPSAGESASSSPTASLMTSSSGQNVMPSPYGRQRPRTTSARPRDVGEELSDEPGLADAGRAEHREELAGAVADGLLERVVQPPALALAADHRGDESARAARERRPPRSTSRKPPIRPRVRRLDARVPRRAEASSSSTRISPGSAACASRDAR